MSSENLDINTQAESIENTNELNKSPNKVIPISEVYQKESKASKLSPTQLSEKFRNLDEPLLEDERVVKSKSPTKSKVKNDDKYTISNEDKIVIEENEKTQESDDKMEIVNEVDSLKDKAEENNIIKADSLEDNSEQNRAEISHSINDIDSGKKEEEKKSKTPSKLSSICLKNNSLDNLEKENKYNINEVSLKEPNGEEVKSESPLSEENFVENKAEEISLPNTESTPPNSNSEKVEQKIISTVTEEIINEKCNLSQNEIKENLNENFPLATEKESQLNLSTENDEATSNKEIMNGDLNVNGKGIILSFI